MSKPPKPLSRVQEFEAFCKEVLDDLAAMGPEEKRLTPEQEESLQRIQLMVKEYLDKNPLPPEKPMSEEWAKKAGPSDPRSKQRR